MKNFSALGIVLAAVLCVQVYAQDSVPLRLLQSIPMPNVKGRIDHMDVDVSGKRLFVAGLENGSVDVIDLAAGKWIRSIPGFKKPQGIAYVSDLNRLFVASGDDGTVRVFRGNTLELLDSIKLDLGANRVVYDTHKKLLYVGYGGKDAGKAYGSVGIVDVKTDKHVADIQVNARPAELLLNKSGQTLFVFVSTASQVQVVDTKKRQVIATWAVSNQRNGDGAIDEATHRLLMGTRTPPQMIAMDSNSGKEVARLPTVDGMDGVYFDSTLRRVYISGGRDTGVGYVFVYQQMDPDHYQNIAKIPTKPGAGTSFWSPELRRYYVAAPAHENEEAAILVFEPQP